MELNVLLHLAGRKTSNEGSRGINEFMSGGCSHILFSQELMWDFSHSFARDSSKTIFNYVQIISTKVFEPLQHLPSLFEIH